MKQDARAELQRVFERLRGARFPRDSLASEELSDLHAELAEYDGHVAGIATSLLGAVRVEPSALVPDSELGEQLERAARDSDDQVRTDAEAYLAYYQLLNDVLSAASRCARA